MTLKYITAAMVAGIGLSVSAQSLKKEITVERDIVPERREATRLSLTPKIELAPVKAGQLSYTDRFQTVKVDGSISPLEPVASGDSLYISPYRGYAGIGFFPSFNLGASAGYRFIDDGATRLNGWFQYDGTSYKGETESGEKIEDSFKRHDATIGFALTHKADESSTLDAAAGYTYSRYNNPIAGSDDHTANRANLSVLWKSMSGDLNYNLGARYGFFGYGGEFGAKESCINITGMAGADLDAGSGFRVDIDASFVVNSGGCWLDGESFGLNQESTEVRMEAFNHGMLTLTPAYTVRSSTYDVQIGARVDLTYHAGKAFHIAPAVKAVLMPSPYFNFFVKATGGEHQNTLLSLFGVTPYGEDSFFYRNSHVALNVDGGITVGPWQGAYAQLYGAYAIANDWLMPIQFYDGCNFSAVDVKGWKAGLAVGYSYASYVDLRASVETAPQKYDRFYYTWRDRAKYVADLQLRVTPISALDITAGWELRGKRIAYAYYEPTVDLGDISLVSVGALYRIDSQWSAFVRGENLLNKRYLLFGSVPAQGITGLAGVSYKF